MIFEFFPIIGYVVEQSLKLLLAFPTFPVSSNFLLFLSIPPNRVILQAEKSSSSVEDESASKAPEQPVSPRGTAGGCGSPSGASLRSKFSSLGEMELGDVYITEDDFRVSLSRLSKDVCVFV